MRTELTQEQLRCLLEYDPDTGLFTWRARTSAKTEHHLRTWNTKYAGKEAGRILRVRSGPYVQICIHARSYLAHRLAWLYMTGEMPILDIDHHDGDGLNNRWQNLRIATKSQNEANSDKQANNNSGFKGVNYNGHAKRYAARIMVDGVRQHLGYFDTPEDAGRAYQDAARQHFGEFARINHHFV